MQWEIQLDRAAATPLYRQVAEALAGMVRAGTLAPGPRLPTVRELAAALKVTRPTVHRAYRELQQRGVVEATVGRGTFVRGRPAGLPAPAAPTGGRGGLTPDRVLGDIQRFDDAAGHLNMAHAEPDRRLVPAAEFWDCFAELKDEAAAHMRYISPQGDPVLREELSRLLRERGVQAGPEEILVTSGVTQGMSLAARALARPGDRVAVEQPTYLGLLHILQAEGLQPVGIPLDDQGPRLDVLDRVIAQDRPRFFYTIATFHNPTGRSMSLARRRELLTLAGERGLTLVEDDIYHRLAYDGPPPPPLAGLDGGKGVIYLDGLSKAVLPGIRIGFAVAPPPLLERMASLRRAADLCGSSPLHRATATFLRRGVLGRHLRKVLPVYAARRDALLEALGESMPPEASWSAPQGGFCCWLALPPGMPAAELYLAALDAGILLAPGDVFLVEPDSRGHLRLCYGNMEESDIRRAVDRLGTLLHDLMEKRPSRPAPALDQAPLV